MYQGMLTKMYRIMKILIERLKYKLHSFLSSCMDVEHIITFM